MTESATQSFPGKTRILLAEDNPDIMRLVSFYLKNMRNAEVSPCKDGGVAMAALANGSFDIAVLDGSMPVADGLTVLRWMRARAELVLVPFIFLTANHDRGFEKECLAAGAQLVMTKPFNPGLLVRKIRDMLSSRTGG